MKTLDSFDVKNKIVIVRVDLNSPYDPKKKSILDNERIALAKTTIKELSSKKAKTIVLAHQGRRGDDDFTHLGRHAKLLQKHVGKKIRFIRDVIGKKAVSAIKSMKPGDVILLDNVRLLKDEETPGKSRLVKTLSPLADLFINDAFSVSHRNQASVSGFRLPSCFGRLMQKELEALENVLNPEGINTYIFGGAKSDDCIEIMEHILKTKPEEMEYALLCGVTANIFMIAAGIRAGKGSEDLIRKKGLWEYVGRAGDLLKKYRERIVLPVDVAIEINGKRAEKNIHDIPEDSTILDIGRKTVGKFTKIINESRTLVIKGPAGRYEDKRFRKGTKDLFSAAAGSKAYTVIGGGDTNLAIDCLKIRRSRFCHVSLGGGALITYLSGKPMPGIEAVQS